jgi:tetratricopeptide (TPR) repeat protein
VAFAAGFAGRHNEMKSRFDRLTETHPESPFTYSGLAAYEFWVQGRVDHALRETLLAVKADPNDTSQRVFVANHLKNLGDDEAAGRWFDSAFALQPESLEAHAFLLLSQIERNQLQEATAAARRIAADYGRSGLIWDWISELLASADIESGNPEAAIARYAEAFPDFWGDDAQALTIWASGSAIEMVRLLRVSGETDAADRILDETIALLEAAPLAGVTGSGFALPAAYAIAGRHADAVAALRKAVDAGYRVGWRYFFDYHWSFESLRDDPVFDSMRIELAADMEKQLENARRMQANGEMPTIPGMELLSRPEKSGAPPI